MRMCKICLLPAPTRKRIDAELYLGTSYKKIAAKFSKKDRSFSHVCVFRHRQHLIPQDVVRRPPPADPQVATTLLGRVEQLIAEFRSIADATKVQQPPWAIAAMKEIMHGLEMIGKITGEISPANFNFNNFNFANVSDTQLAAFLDAMDKPEAARVRQMVLARMSHSQAPQLVVNFVDPKARLSQLDEELFDSLQSVCRRDAQFRERVKTVIATIEGEELRPASPLLEAAPANGHA
jgi:hypothetical protein